MCSQWNIVQGIQSRRDNSQPEIFRLELKLYKINHGHIEYIIDNNKCIIHGVILRFLLRK